VVATGLLRANDWLSLRVECLVFSLTGSRNHHRSIRGIRQSPNENRSVAEVINESQAEHPSRLNRWLGTESIQRVSVDNQEIYLHRLRAAALFVLCIAPFTYAQKHVSDSLAYELRAKDEMLLNAVHRGDRKAWAELTTPDFLYIEDGVITDRKGLLNELEEDGNAPLAIQNYTVHQIGDTAIVLHRDDVTARPHRDTSRMHFLFSETWQKIDDHWMLRLIDINRLRSDPPFISLTDSQIDELVGTYKVAQKTLVIRREGHRILVSMPGLPDTEWKAETRDVLFEPGDLLTRKIFQRNAVGIVTEMISRDQASDLVWVRQK
jgi:hypothetical protein